MAEEDKVAEEDEVGNSTGCTGETDAFAWAGSGFQRTDDSNRCNNVTDAVGFSRAHTYTHLKKKNSKNNTQVNRATV
jgi:hypothetical protein